MRSLHSYLPAGILFAGCALVWQARSQAAVPLVGPLSSVMSDVRDYQVTEQTLSPEERRVAGMTDYVARVYVRDSSVAFTTLVSYYDRQTQGRSIHSPRNCLPGAGWEIMDGGTHVVAVDGVPRQVNRYLLRNGRAMALAYYWYQGRGRVTASEYTVKWNLLRDAALKGHTEEALVRIVLPLSDSQKPPTVDVDAGLKAADGLATEVAARLIRDVDKVLPGSPSS